MQSALSSAHAARPLLCPWTISFVCNLAALCFVYSCAKSHAYSTIYKNESTSGEIKPSTGANGMNELSTERLFILIQGELLDGQCSQQMAQVTDSPLTFRRFTHVLAVGKRDVSIPASRIANFGCSSLKPSSGGLAQLVTNRSSCLLRS